MEIERFFKEAFIEVDKSQEKCPDLETVCAYSDNSLTISNRKNIEEHILNCSSCFSIYTNILKEKDKLEEEEYKTPEWLKNKVAPESFSLESFILKIREKWSWLSWSTGMGFGMAIALTLFILTPGIFQHHSENSGPVPNFFPTPDSTAGSALPANLIVQTSHTDLYSAEFHYNKGMELIENSPEKAREEFIQAVKYNTDYAEAHWQLGLIYEKEGNYEKALRHWKRYSFLAPRVGSYKDAKEYIEKTEKIMEK